jgi:hypothetical protein
MNVDARSLYCVLERAAVAAGVELMEGTSARGMVYDATGKAAAAVSVCSAGHVCHAPISFRIKSYIRMWRRVWSL